METTLFINRLKQLFFRFFWKNKTLTATAKKYQLTFRFNVNDGIGGDIYYKYGVYAEDYITSFLLKEIDIQDKDLILDIGANIGWYSLVLSYKARPTIYSFEPEPRNFSFLSENVRINGRTNINPVNAAVDNKPGIMQLHLYKNHNQGRHSFIRHKKSIGTVDVKTIVVDQFLRDKGLSDQPVKFLKIDIEGYEFTALRGAAETLKRTTHVLSEFSPSIMQEIQEDPKEYIRFMDTLGFQPYEITPSGIIPAALDRMLAAGDQVYNIFWSRKSF